MHGTVRTNYHRFVGLRLHFNPRVWIPLVNGSRASITAGKETAFRGVNDFLLHLKGLDIEREEHPDQIGIRIKWLQGIKAAVESGKTNTDELNRILDDFPEFTTLDKPRTGSACDDDLPVAYTKQAMAQWIATLNEHRHPGCIRSSQPPHSAQQILIGVDVLLSELPTERAEARAHAVAHVQDFCRFLKEFDEERRRTPALVRQRIDWLYSVNAALTSATVGQGELERALTPFPKMIALPCRAADSSPDGGAAATTPRLPKTHYTRDMMVLHIAMLNSILGASDDPREELFAEIFATLGLLRQEAARLPREEDRRAHTDAPPAEPPEDVKTRPEGQPAGRARASTLSQLSDAVTDLWHRLRRQPLPFQ